MRVLQAGPDLVAVRGELTPAASPRFAEALEVLREAGAGQRAPVVDLTEATDICGACIGALVSLWAEFLACGRYYELRASDPVWLRLRDAGIATAFLRRPSPAMAAGEPVRTSDRRTEVTKRERRPVPCAPGASAETARSGQELYAARSASSVEAEIERYVERVAALEREVEEHSAARARAEEDVRAMRESRNSVAAELVKLKKAAKARRARERRAASEMRGSAASGRSPRTARTAKAAASAAKPKRRRK